MKVYTILTNLSNSVHHLLTSRSSPIFLKDSDSRFIIFLSTPTPAIILRDFNSHETEPLFTSSYSPLTFTSPVMLTLILYQSIQPMILVPQEIRSRPEHGHFYFQLCLMSEMVSHTQDLPPNRGTNFIGLFLS